MRASCCRQKWSDLQPKLLTWSSKKIFMHPKGDRLFCLRLVYHSDLVHFGVLRSYSILVALWYSLSKDASLTKQIENEYGNGDIESRYGPRAKPYVNWAAKMATSLDTGVPWVMCQQPDAPDPIVSFPSFPCALFIKKTPWELLIDYQIILSWTDCQ